MTAALPRVSTAMSFAVALSYAMAAAQSFSPMFAPMSNQKFTAYCYDVYGNKVPYCDVVVYTGYYEGSNGHFRSSSGHTYSSVSPSSGNTGAMGLPVTVTTTLIGEAEAVVACAVGTGGCNGPNYGIGYSDLDWNYHSNIWIQTGGNTTNHGDNTYDHWMQSAPAIDIYVGHRGLPGDVASGAGLH